MNKQSSFLDDVAQANRDELIVDPAHIRRRQMEASWQSARAVYCATWQAALTHALNVGDSERAEFCKERIAYLKGIR